MRLNQSIGKHYPVKTNINLAMKDSRKREWGKVAVAGVCLALFIAAFTKFAVVDRLVAANKAEYSAGKSAAELTALQAANLPYNEVLEEYNDYHLSQSVSQLKTDIRDVFGLVERELLPASQVESFTVTEGTIVTRLSGVTLTQISRICESLTADPLVAGVQVFTASAKEEVPGSLATTSITITLAIEAGTYEKDGDGAAAAADSASADTERVLRLDAGNPESGFTVTLNDAGKNTGRTEEGGKTR